MAKYKIIAEKLADSIKKGVFSDSTLPSESAICRKYSVSRITARAALKALENSGIATVIPGKGRVVNSVGCKVDFNSRAKEPKSLACICSPGLMLPAYGIVYNKIKELCAKSGLLDTLFFLENGTIDSFAAQLVPEKFAGVISIGIIGPSVIDSLLTLDVQAVCAAFDHPRTPNSVSIDNYAGGWLAADYLLENGQRNILVVNNKESSDPSYAHREDGFMKRISEEKNSCKVSFSLPGTDNFVAAMKKNGPGAVFLTTDMFAPEVLSGLRLLKLKIPGDISILGYDNMVNNQVVLEPRIDSFEQDWIAVADNAFRLATGSKEKNIRIAVRPVLKTYGTVIKRKKEK